MDMISSLLEPLFYGVVVTALLSVFGYGVSYTAAKLQREAAERATWVGRRKTEKKG